MAKARKRVTVKDRIRAAAEEFLKYNGQTEEERTKFYEGKHKGKRLIDLAYEMDDIKRVKEYLDRLSTRVNAEFDALRLMVIPSLMEDEGIENLTVEDLGRLGLTGDMYVSIKAGKKEEFFQWLNKHKLGDLIVDTVNPSTLKSFVKLRMDAGKDLPVDLLNVSPYTRASITKV
jgi:hypothetical protein